MVCHGELSRSRPAAQHLTAFYMWMSAGGVIGGIFAGLIAPNIFSSVVEYPALVVLAILCRPGLEMPSDTRTRLLWLGAAAVVAVVAFPGLTERYVTDEKAFNWTIGAMLVIAGLVSREPLPFAAVIAVVFIVGQAYRPDSEVRETMRSFFGVHKITETADGRFRVFLHGTTIHGAERLRDDAGRADHRQAAADHLLPCEFADGRHGAGDASARRRADQGGGGRSRHRYLRVLRGAGRQFQVLRDRRERREARARSESIQLHFAVRAGGPGRAR